MRLGHFGILDTLDLPILVVGHDCRVKFFNQTAAEVLGPVPAAIGWLPSNLALLSDFKDIENLCKQAMAGGVPRQCEIRIGDRYFVLRIAPYPCASGKCEEAALIFSNVTAFRASISRAIHEREFTKTILNTVAEPLVVLDSDLRIQTGNRAFYATFGLSRETAKGVPLTILGNHDWKHPLLWASVKESLCDKSEFKTREVEGDFPAIGRRTFLFDACRLADEGASLILISLRDITERKRAEIALSESEERYRTLFNSMDEGFCIIEVIFDESQKPVDYCFLEVNPAFAKQTGISLATGKRMRELAPEHEQHWFDIYGKIALMGEPARFENHAAAFNRWYEVYAFRIEPPEARRVGIVFNDITERRQQQEKLERTIAERTVALRETVAELEAFSYSIAHDMRAPLRGMQGLANILLEDHASHLDAEAADYLRRISVSAQRLDRLIQDVLNYSKIVKGKVVIEPVDLDQLLRDIINAYPSFQLLKAEIQIKRPLPKVLGNAAFLTQCISNLLSNAIKFVSPGALPHVRIWAEEINPLDHGSGEKSDARATSAPSSLDQHSIPRQVRLYVEDNGIGIAGSERARIFQMFERIHPATEYEGTGIGLTVARKAAERIGAKIGFESEIGKGTKFWIQIKTI
jgi:PAS domain S-box-containing protein